jgi:hypothetical protein
MKRFLLNILVFCITGMLIGEVIARTMHLTSDIPRRTIDQHNIQKYLPGQQGYWKGGDHSWSINTMGWPGELPENFDNLQVIIGDSFIENFMNPRNCHQSVFLKQELPQFNFLEAARSGVSLIEAMEISKELDSLNPEGFLFYVKDEDFIESIREIKVLNDITQLSLKDQTIVPGKMKAPGLKRILYNWKFLYYLYNRFPIGRNSKPEKAAEKEGVPANNQKEITALIKFITNKYSIENKTLVFMPNTNKSIIEACKVAGFKTIALNSEGDRSWTFDYDSHWTCYGHGQAAGQVARFLNKSTH